MSRLWQYFLWNSQVQNIVQETEINMLSPYFKKPVSCFFPVIFSKNNLKVVLLKLYYLNYIQDSGIVLCELYTFFNHVCSTNGKSLKRRFHPYQVLKIVKNRLTGF